MQEYLLYAPVPETVSRQLADARRRYTTPVSSPGVEFARFKSFNCLDDFVEEFNGFRAPQLAIQSAGVRVVDGLVRLCVQESRAVRSVQDKVSSVIDLYALTSNEYSLASGARAYASSSGLVSPPGILLARAQETSLVNAEFTPFCAGSLVLQEVAGEDYRILRV